MSWNRAVWRLHKKQKTSCSLGFAAGSLLGAGEHERVRNRLAGAAAHGAFHLQLAYHRACTRHMLCQPTNHSLRMPR